MLLRDFIVDFFQRNYCFNLTAVENVLFVSFLLLLLLLLLLLVVAIDVCLFVCFTVVVVPYSGLQNIQRLNMTSGKSL